jgi:hypothetical protein
VYPELFEISTAKPLNRQNGIDSIFEYFFQKVNQFAVVVLCSVAPGIPQFNSRLPNLMSEIPHTRLQISNRACQSPNLHFPQIRSQIPPITLLIYNSTYPAAGSTYHNPHVKFPLSNTKLHLSQFRYELRHIHLPATDGFPEFTGTLMENVFPRGWMGLPGLMLNRGEGICF